MSALTKVLAVASLVSVVACGSSVIRDDDGGPGDDGDDGGACCLALPTCGPDAVEVEQCTNGNCFTVEKCCEEILCQSSGSCFGSPTCAAHETEVTTCAPGVSCREVSMCGLTILCQDTATCDGYPQCDEGDTEIEGACPPDASCYGTSLCGVTIYCLDTSLPEHGCPPEPPAQSTQCDVPSHVCNYDLGNGCFETYECQTGGDLSFWAFIGGGCDD
jgi:hypothetical protein